jgi:hypothetical protein
MFWIGPTPSLPSSISTSPSPPAPAIPEHAADEQEDEKLPYSEQRRKSGRKIAS